MMARSVEGARGAAVLGLAVVLALGAPAALHAQFTRPPAPAAYALTDVTVVHADGRREAGVTVVVRNGRIEALARGGEPPGDAEILEGDSLHVYPGLIDAWGSAEFEFPEAEVDRSDLASWDPPREVQGFMPHRRVADYLTAVGSRVDGPRKKGVVAAAVHPKGAVMPGRGVFLILRKSAETPHALIADAELGPVMTLQGAQGVYPATLFAVIAFYRQKFEDARHLASHAAAYGRDPGAVRIPGWDPDLRVLQAAAAGEARVYFAADLARDIRRVLQLSSEFGLRPIILGGEEAWKVAGELRSAQVPVLISLDFPEPKRWKPPEEESGEAEEEPEPGVAAEGEVGAAEGEAAEVEAEAAGAAEQDREPREEEARQQPEPLDAAAEREKQRLEDIYSNAGRLASAGVAFALTSGAGQADLREGARKAIEYGLDEAAALRALTATPAELLGMPHLARLQRGGSATFVVTDGPLFEEDTKVVYTLVEGELEKGPKEAPSEEPSVDVTGTWSLRIESPEGVQTATAELEQTGAEFRGRMRTEFGDGRVQDGTVSGNSVTFAVVFEVGGERFRVDLEGTVEGDRASGSGSSPQGDFRWTAERRSGPEGEERR